MAEASPADIRAAIETRLLYGAANRQKPVGNLESAVARLRNSQHHNVAA